MKVTITGPIKKREYEYKTVNLNQTGLKGWDIAVRWGNKAPIYDVQIDKKGDIFITVRRKLKKGE